MLLLPAVAALAFAGPSSSSLLLGALAALPALGLRAWAFAHLGGCGRTRDPSPPRERVSSGPYAFLGHPVYVANVGLAAAMLVAAAPPILFGGLLALGIAAFYGALARRESVQIAGLPRLARRPAWSSIPRWERSTWGTTGLWFVLLVALV